MAVQLQQKQFYSLGLRFNVRQVGRKKYGQHKNQLPDSM